MKQRFIISAMSLSFPGTMGGNSKITLEMARHLRDEYEVHFIVPDAKVKTVTDNLSDCLSDLHLHVVKQYAGNEKFDVVGASRHYYHEILKALEEIQPTPNDWLFSCCDFHSDSIPNFLLQKRFGYKWLPSAFLFVPFIVENLRKGYKFPPLLYLMAWAYAKLFVFIAVRRATGFVITNESDFKHFPKRFRAHRLFPYYGGVNIDQIPAREPETRNQKPETHADTQSINRKIEKSKNLSVVFCSRLHPQKGIDGFLDTWKLIHDKLPDARFTVIGNGAPDYEQYLRDKADRLGVADSIDWMGYVNNEAKFNIYAQSRLLVHATVFDNNGMVAAEALCTGLPVVMYDLPALRHVYTTGCVKIPFGNKQAFADEVVLLLTDPAHYATIAPTPDQVAALRAHWDWASRAHEFTVWLKQLDTHA